MRILLAQNHHAGPGGTEVLFRSTVDLLRRKGHEVFTVERDNADLSGIWSKMGAFGSAIYSRAAKRDFAGVLLNNKVEVAHFFNIYPQLSTSVIDACWEAKVPAVLSVHDYKYTCPTAQHLRKGKVCEKCMGGFREWNCALHNCRGSWPMSVSYALRNATARWRGTLQTRVSAYVTPTRFVGDQLAKGGFPRDRIVVVSNPFDLKPESVRETRGDYAAYVGRISKEKGLPILIEAARQTGIPTRIAGDVSPMPELRNHLPANVHFTGPLSRDQLPDFYRNARYLVIPSVWYEVFGLVAAEAMSYGLPVIASNLGGLPEVVDDGHTGLLCPAGDAVVLAVCMKRLWDDPDLCRQFGTAGRIKAETNYHVDRYYDGYIDVYKRAIDSHIGLHH